MKKNLIAALFFLCAHWTFGQASSATIAEWLETKAKSGEDAQKLLTRFALSGYDCNLTQFVSLNDLRGKNPRLRAGENYLIPVAVVDYNGESIRSTLDLNDWKAAKRIENYNKTAVQKGWRKDNFIDTRELWVPFHELECPEKTAEKEKDEEPRIIESTMRALGKDEASAFKNRNFTIFGGKYAKTPLLSNRLKGRIFYLISGHGGPDTGAQGKRAGNTLCEDEYAYDVTLRLLRLLLSHGATVYMIVRDPNDGIRDGVYLRCDKDEEVLGNLDIPQDQKERLTQRTDLVNAHTEKNRKAGRTHQTVIEIHVDSRSKHTNIDAFFYYRPESESSKKLADRIHQTFKSKYAKLRGGRGYEGTVSARGLHTLLETAAPRAVYIELANIQNDWDQQRIVLKNNRQALANWILQALLTEK